MDNPQTHEPHRNGWTAADICNENQRGLISKAAFLLEHVLPGALTCTLMPVGIPMAVLKRAGAETSMQNAMVVAAYMDPRFSHLNDVRTLGRQIASKAFAVYPEMRESR